jgi:hypothetical protein
VFCPILLNPDLLLECVEELLYLPAVLVVNPAVMSLTFLLMKRFFEGCQPLLFSW